MSNTNGDIKQKQPSPDCNEWSFKNNIVLAIGIIIKVALLVLGYSDHDDNSGQLKFTDIDYFVFTDAAKYVLEGGSPYDRITYRYTPLMAYVVIPNHLLHPMFGKILFTALEILCIILIRKIIQSQFSMRSCVPYQNYLEAWILLNPLIITTSPRGSNDILVAFVVLMFIYLLIKRWYILSGALFGLSVHLKIYPIIYGFPLILFIDRKKGEIARANVLLNPRNWFTARKLKFFGTSAIVFFSLLYLFFEMYGFEFLYESYIYHSERVDHRHNFSFNYYFEYFYYDELPENKYLVRKLGFVAQWGLVSYVGIRFYNDLTSAVALQTFIFVMFNRVCTAQYFLWYMIFMPFIAIKYKKLLAYQSIFLVLVIMLLGNLMVNLSNAPLELLGMPSYDYIFVSTHLYLIINSCLAFTAIKNLEFTDTKYFDEIEKEKIN
ncbi:unnamed protein product [Moneuplotes crassus]|uniref:GPI mannosyltransferase 1 n=1 Tax=Euplotes crassus TaxID=5936 RepID=A0AAD1UBZ8_EUPCR|nr:unnamed protein product [Moneuplotes crassus]